MNAYTIAAIPTVYNGTLYRSRLEARWGAFLHLLGMEAEYEPFDLGEWSPDFLLRSGGTRGPALGEVKPISDFDPGVAARMDRAVRGRHQPADRLLLIGVGPFPDDGGLCAGWTRHSGCDHWRPARIARRPDGRWAFGDDPLALSGWQRMVAAVSRGWVSDTERADRTWKRACNAVQWRKSA